MGTNIVRLGTTAIVGIKMRKEETHITESVVDSLDSSSPPPTRCPAGAWSACVRVESRRIREWIHPKGKHGKNYGKLKVVCSTVLKVISPAWIHEIILLQQYGTISPMISYVHAKVSVMTRTVTFRIFRTRHLL